MFDQSGHGHDGVVHEAEWLRDGRGKGNGVLHFQGEDSYVDLGDILNTLDYPVTISVWMKVDEAKEPPADPCGHDLIQRALFTSR